MRLSRVCSFGLVLGLVLTLSACGGKDEKKEEKKEDANAKKEDGKGSGGGGGGSASSNTLVGTWNLDTASMIAKMEAEATTDEQKAQLELGKKMIESMKMSFEFTDDGKMMMKMTPPIGEPQTEEGTYKVTSSEGSKIVFSGTIKGEEKEVTATFSDADTVEMAMEGEEDVMMFKRAK